MALGLITQRDSFEIVRDQIAGILLAELANQQSLAGDPLDYTLSVYLERDFPLEQWLNSGATDTAATSPVVNISVESMSRNDAATAVNRGIQVYDTTYQIDVTARGVSRILGGGGHTPADQDARFRCHAAVRLVRKILSALPNRRLLLPEIVSPHPSFENLEFGPAALDADEPNISAWNCRMRFRVTMDEFSPELVVTNSINVIRIDVSDDGGVILSAEYT